MKKKIIILIIIIAIVIVGVVIFINNNKEEESHENLVATDPTSDKITVQDLKNELGATGPDDIYEVSEEYDGRKILTVKTSIEYNVAVAGALSEDVPTFETLDTILESKPTGTGVWITEGSRQSITEMINQLTDGRYSVDSDGYLQVEAEGSNDYDEKINNLINSEKLYMMDINGSNYIVDPMSGEITLNEFEAMDPYQTYEYYEYDNEMIIFITTNQAKRLTDEEIISSILELCQ